MKTLGMIGLMGVMLCGCDDGERSALRARVKTLEKEISVVKAKSMRMAAENHEILLENERLMLEVTKARGRAMVSEAEDELAKSRVENARKLGKAEALLERAEGK